MPSSVHIDVGLGTETEPVMALSSGDPFRIALLGDFGGRANRREPRLHRDPQPVDPDNFEDVMGRFETGLELSAGGAPLPLRFRSLDDFHPDHLYDTLPLFQTLRRTRAQLADPATFRAAAARLRPAPPPAPAPAPAPAKPFSGSLLDQIVEQTAGDAAPPPPPAPGREASLDEAIRRIVQPHLLPRPDPRQDELVAQVDAAASAAMRAILGHPQFQALEAAWRSAYFLLQRVETGVDLKLNLVDITREELVEAALSGLAPCREGWSVAACLHAFSPSEADCAVLARLAGIARQAGGPLLAGIHPRLMGCESMAATPDPDDWKQPLDAAGLAAWQRLRSHPDARWIGLALPRILLRLPYGRATSPADSFDFEEMPQPPVHESYLWGSPAVAAACLLGQSFNLRGWRFHPGLRSRLDGMPVHSYREAGAPRMTPPAETLITDRTAERILDQGAMPLASSRSSDAILLVRWQSIADPPSPLAGPWE